MRAICVFAALVLPAFSFAQGVIFAGGGGSSSSGGPNGIVTSTNGSGSIRFGSMTPFGQGQNAGTGNITATLHADAPSALSRDTYITSYRGRSSGSISYFTRTVIDTVKHEYSGYEVL